MSTTTITCWNCHKSMQVYNMDLNKKIHCPTCHQITQTRRPSYSGEPIASPYMGEPDSFQTNKSPSTAAVLNFLFPGAGYIYVGKAWGWFILFFTIITSIAYCYQNPQIMQGQTQFTQQDLIDSLIFLPMNFAFAWHGYKLARGE